MQSDTFPAEVCRTVSRTTDPTVLTERSRRLDWPSMSARNAMTTPAFNRLVRLVATALELADQLTAADIRDLIGSRTCAAYGIPTSEEQDDLAA
jgi:hypothetical protein